MAVETVQIALDRSWKLISSAIGGALVARTVSRYDAQFYVGPNAPSAIEVNRRATSILRVAAQADKVWARSDFRPTDAIQVTRVVDAGNPALPTPQVVTLSNATLPSGAEPLSAIGQFVGLVEGDEIIGISPNDGRVLLSADRTGLLVGRSSRADGTLDVSIRIRNTLAEPNRRTVQFTVTLGAGGGGTPTPPWNPATATVWDYRNNRFARSGTVMADEAAMQAALVGADPLAFSTAGGVVRSFGRYKAPGITELLFDPGFDGTPAGVWTATQQANGPATLTIANGEGTLTANGATSPAVSQPIQSDLGAAYRLSAKVRRDATSTGSGRVNVSDVPTLATATSQSNNLASSTSETTLVTSFSCLGNAVQLHAGVMTQATAPAGANIISDMRCSEVVPFDGYQRGSISGEVSFLVNAADLTGKKVLLSYDSGASFERTYFQVAAVGGELRLLSWYETVRGTIGQQASLLLGTLATGYHKVQYAATYGIMAGKLDAAAAVSMAPAFLPGVAVMRIHGSQTAGQEWSNADTVVTHYSALTMPDGISSTIWGVYGDSYHGISASIAKASGVIVSSKGQGGQTVQSVEVNQVNANPQFWGKTAILWDGKPNGYDSDYIPCIQRILAKHGAAKLFVIGPAKTAAGSAENATIDQINTDLAAILPANRFRNPNLVIPQVAGACDPIYSPDKVHYSTAAMDLIAASIKNDLAAM